MFPTPASQVCSASPPCEEGSLFCFVVREGHPPNPLRWRTGIRTKGELLGERLSCCASQPSVASLLRIPSLRGGEFCFVLLCEKDIPLTPFAGAQAFAQRGNCWASGSVAVLPTPASQVCSASPPCREGSLFCLGYLVGLVSVFQCCGPLRPPTHKALRATSPSFDSAQDDRG